MLLWLDPDGGFTRLRDAVAPELVTKGATLLSLDPGGSQFELKLQLLEIEASGGRAVVHLPRPDRRGLRGDARWPPACPLGGGRIPVQGQRLGPSPWGRRRSIRRRWTNGSRAMASGSPAAVPAARSSPVAPTPSWRGTPRKRRISTPAEFPRPVNSTSISPAGDPRDRVIELLLDPAQAVDGWGESRADVLELAADT